MSTSQVFVSYASVDASRVMKLVEPLRAAGVSIWRDKEGLLAGSTYGSQIVQAIEQAQVVMVVCSRNSLASQNVRNEVITNWDRGKRRYLPVWIERPTEIPGEMAYWLAGCQWMDLSNPHDTDWLAKVLAALDSMGIRPEPSAVTLANETRRVSNDVADTALATPPLVEICSVEVARTEQRRWAAELQFPKAVVIDNMPMQLIPPGTSSIGACASDRSAEADERPQIPVNIHRAMLVTQSPVTCGMLRRCLHHFPASREWQNWGRQVDRIPDDAPAVEVSLRQIVGFCGLVNEKSGLRLRLPTEAEWEYFSRAGSNCRFWWGDDFHQDRVISSARHPQPCSPTRANAWGVIDALGNVAEWTSSAYGPLHSGSAFREAAPDCLESRYRVIRGGSYRERRPEELRISRRQRVAADSTARHIGFRLVTDAADVRAVMDSSVDRKGTSDHAWIPEAD